jgi:hypothetical protein
MTSPVKSHGRDEVAGQAEPRFRDAEQHTRHHSSDIAPNGVDKGSDGR